MTRGPKRVFRAVGILRAGCATALIALTGVLSPQPVMAETLRDALRDAYLYDPSLEAQRAQLMALGEDVALARSRRMPTLSGSASLALTRSGVSLGNLSNSEPATLGLTGSLPLYDGGQAANQVSQARATVDSSYSSLRNIEQATMLLAVTAFFDVLRDAELRDLSRDTLKLLVEELDASEARFEVGEVTLTDVAQTRARVAEANSALVQADGALRVSAESYRATVGRLPGELIPPQNLPKLPETLTAAETEALAKDPAIIAARAGERAAVFAVRAAQASALPSVNLQTSLSSSFSDVIGNEDNYSLSGQLSLQLSAPIYQGGATASAVRRARFVASQRRSEYHAAVRAAQQEVTVAWNQLGTAKGAIEAGKERVRAADIAFAGVKEELFVGSRATIDLLNAERERLTARNALVRAVRDLNVAAYTLLAAMGRLEPESFGIDPVDGGRSGLRGVEPASLFGVPDVATTAWRFPWRP